MRIAFIFGSPKISGGTYVILQHALFLQEQGHEVSLITREKVQLCEDEIWHEGLRVIPFKSILDAQNEEYDLVIATWWESPFFLHHLNSKQYAYFVQSIEAYFFDSANLTKQFLAHQSYLLDLPVITEATWIKKDLENRYNANVFLVKNGISKVRYSTFGKVISKRRPGFLRCLVEGPVDVKFKAVDETVKALRKSKADEVWLLTSSDIKSYDGVDRVFSRISPSEVGEIYRSCDVIVKQSYVEGMFGPPLEMFHCGGTAVVSNVTGFDEYLKHGFNALVNDVGDWSAVIRNVNYLKDNPNVLNSLKENALLTAESWPDWETQSILFEKALYKIMELNPVDRNSLAIKANHAYEMHDLMSSILKRYYGKKKVLSTYPIRLSKSPSCYSKTVHQQELTMNKQQRKLKVLGFSISNETIEELWHPVITRADCDYLYVCCKPKGYFHLWKNKEVEIDNSRYLLFNWIQEPKRLYQIIENFCPDVLLVHNGSHPSYQKILLELNSRYRVPIVFSELGWLPQRNNIYFDSEGTNAHSSIAHCSYEAFCGEKKSSESEEELKNNKVLLVLQLENDMNFIDGNPNFKSNLELVKYVIDSIPERYDLIIKPHPLDNNSYIYDSFNTERIQVVKDSTLESLLKECNSIIAINSTCLIEALQYPVNIYCGGKSILNNKGLVFDFNNQNLKDVWRDKYVNNSLARSKFLETLKHIQLDITSLCNMSDEEFFTHPSIKVLLSSQYKKLYKKQSNDTSVIHAGNRLTPKSLSELIASIKNFDVVSFDLMDTLLDIQFRSSTDVHKFYSSKVARIVGSAKFNHFEERLSAEKRVREYSLKDEISLDEIYQQYLMQTGLPAFKIKKIQLLEEQAWLDSVCVRAAGKVLFEAAQGLGKKVIVTSDFFLGKSFVSEALIRNGFKLEGVEIFVSCDIGKSKKIQGGLYKHLISFLGVEASNILHIGDNFAVDVKMALASGLCAVHFPSVKEVHQNATKCNEFMLNGAGYNIFANPTLEGSIIASKIMSYRFSDPYSIDKSKTLPLGLEDVGFSFLGPVIYGFIQWLVKQLSENQIKTVFFMSRDGWLIKKCFDQYCKDKNLDFNSKYVYGSRRFFNICNLKFDFGNMYEILDTRLKCATLADLMRVRFGLTTEELSNDYLSKAGFVNWEEIISLPQDKIRVQKLVCAMKNEITLKSEEYINDFLHHLELENINVDSSEKVALVDIGYFGSLQVSLSKILKEKQIHGYYFATRREIIGADIDLGLSRGYLADRFVPGSPLYPVLTRYLGWLECLFSAPHGSFLNFETKNGQLIPSFSDGRFEKKQWESLNQIHNSALEFVRSMGKFTSIKDSELDFTNNRYDDYLATLLAGSNCEFSKLLSNFILENVYSGEILSFSQSVTPLKKVSKIISIDNNEHTFDLSWMQKVLLKILGLYVRRKCKKEGGYKMYKSNPLDFAKKTKSKTIKVWINRIVK